LSFERKENTLKTSRLNAHYIVNNFNLENPSPNFPEKPKVCGFVSYSSSMKNGIPFSKITNMRLEICIVFYFVISLYIYTKMSLGGWRLKS
jgi:hypothetical protein